jgi:hypothetical protein
LESQMQDYKQAVRSPVPWTADEGASVSEPSFLDVVASSYHCRCGLFNSSSNLQGDSSGQHGILWMSCDLFIYLLTCLFVWWKIQGLRVISAKWSWSVPVGLNFHPSGLSAKENRSAFVFFDAHLPSIFVPLSCNCHCLLVHRVPVFPVSLPHPSYLLAAPA